VDKVDKFSFPIGILVEMKICPPVLDLI